MKKLLSMGLLTLCALALAERPAHAWVNSKFSIGLNWHLQSGNNNVLWGLWKNGQVPGPEAFGQPGGHPGMFGPGPAGPYMQPAAQQQNFPFFGQHANPYGYYGMPQVYPTTEPPLNNPQQAYYGNYNPYQTVSYQYPSYVYPAYYQGYGQQVPYYWYQGR